MTEVLTPSPIQHFHKTDGDLASGYKIFTYGAGTTTKVSTYSNSTGGGANLNTNPIVLNARGEANIWLDATGSYKFVLAPDTDSDPPTASIWTVDNLAIGVASAITVSTTPPAASQGLLWLDTSVNPSPLKVYDATQYVVVGYLDTTNHKFSSALGIPTGATGGTPASQTVTMPIATALLAGQQMLLQNGAGPVTGPSVLAMNGGAGASIVSATGRPLLQGDWNVGEYADLVYTGTSFRLVNPAPIQAANAFINFKGTTSITIRGSYNISSLVRNAQGDYALNFINPMRTTAYSALLTASGDTASDTGYGKIATENSKGNLCSYLVGQCRFYVSNVEATVGPADVLMCNALFFGGG